MDVKIMDLETAEPSNVTWLDIVGRQADASRMICLPPRNPTINAATSSTIVLRPVPMLDWPARLFEDHGCYN